MTTTAIQQTAYDQLLEHIKQANLLGSTGSILGWDQETLMPTGGLAHRSRQLAQLAKLTHQMKTDPRIGEWLGACEDEAGLTDDPLSESAVNLRELRRDYDKATKLPEALVVEMSETTSQAKHAWAEARKANKYEDFKPWLAKVVDLNQRKAECFGWDEADGEPWDALADNFEAGMTAASVSEVFTPLRERLVALLGDILGSKTGPSNTFNELKLPIEQQKQFVKDISAAVGFDYERGRLDESTHPFCSGSHCNDVRMTTRFHEDNVNDALGSTLHESGHGIYEQGLPEQHIGTPMGLAVGLSIHESQSRMWENQVGRSRAFWAWCYPKLAESFGDAASSLTEEQIFGGANIVSPGLIRVEADEATYNLHIMIRFEIERLLMKGELTVDDLPGVWNAKYKEYLQVDVPDDTRGCLQDIHWSMGAIGYFPTYTMGNLYCAQFFEAAKEQLGDLDAMFAEGNFTPLRHWLNENIHAHGQRYRSADLVEHVTGKPLSADPLMRHLEGKLRPLYGV
ncbi:MAG: carboxypeptidase M32 [Phycisphaeraceae bacterium]|nr:carboxypeptidase M32 [Phycisphaeraceae bacterium]